MPTITITKRLSADTSFTQNYNYSTLGEIEGISKEVEKTAAALREHYPQDSLLVVTATPQEEQKRPVGRPRK